MKTKPVYYAMVAIAIIITNLTVLCYSAYFINIESIKMLDAILVIGIIALQLALFKFYDSNKQGIEHINKTQSEEINQLKGENKQKDERIERLEKSLQGYACSRDDDHLRFTLNSKEKELGRCKLELASVHEENRRLTGVYEENRRLTIENSNLDWRIKNLETTSTKERTADKRDIVRLEGCIKQIKKAYEELNVLYTSATSVLVQKEREIEELNGTVGGLKAEYDFTKNLLSIDSYKSKATGKN
jgi:regulator of replication initiation timing